MVGLLLEENTNPGVLFIEINTLLTSSIHGGIPTTVYVNVAVVAPDEGVYIAEFGLKVPPKPDVCAQTPPDCSPVIKSVKCIADEAVSQITKLPSVPAYGFKFATIVNVFVRGKLHAVAPEPTCISLNSIV